MLLNYKHRGASLQRSRLASRRPTISACDSVRLGARSLIVVAAEGRRLGSEALATLHSILNLDRAVAAASLCRRRLGRMRRGRTRPWVYTGSEQSSIFRIVRASSWRAEPARAGCGGPWHAVAVPLPSRSCCPSGERRTLRHPEPARQMRHQRGRPHRTQAQEHRTQGRQRQEPRQSHQPKEPARRSPTERCRMQAQRRT